MPSCTCSSESSRRCGCGPLRAAAAGEGATATADDADRLFPSRLHACFSPAGTLARGARTPHATTPAGTDGGGACDGDGSASASVSSSPSLAAPPKRSRSPYRRDTFTYSGLILLRYRRTTSLANRRSSAVIDAATSCSCCWGSAAAAAAVAGRSATASEARELLSRVNSDASGVASSTRSFTRNRLATGAALVPAASAAARPPLGFRSLSSSTRNLVAGRGSDGGGAASGSASAAGATAATGATTPSSPAAKLSSTRSSSASDAALSSPGTANSRSKKEEASSPYSHADAAMVVAAAGARWAPVSTPPRRYLRKLKESMARGTAARVGAPSRSSAAVEKRHYLLFLQRLLRRGRRGQRNEE
ncbi:hypothetical protein Zm00014a_012255 [Zea mays]|uniref:Uncharacterized protein n=1 Tax=Zea mays TaxID=4577 RepID=A0A3L6DN19_MAIZE|nr:hypothetical protein Zm00014a_012255 [Zea mays]